VTLEDAFAGTPLDAADGLVPLAPALDRFPLLVGTAPVTRDA
jgi:hypothetical protein